MEGHEHRREADRIEQLLDLAGLLGRVRAVSQVDAFFADLRGKARPLPSNPGGTR